MNSIRSISHSGMLASTAHLDAAASNLANVASVGRVPPSPPSKPVPQDLGPEARVYQAVRVVQQSPAGTQPGTTATYKPLIPSYERAYDPSAPYADENGFVARPNVDLVSEAVSLITARESYRANLKVFRMASDLEKDAIDNLA